MSKNSLSQILANRQGTGSMCTSSAEAQWSVLSAVNSRILSDLGAGHALSKKLGSWHQLSFKDFRAEVKRAFKAEIPVRERAEWESYLAEEARKVASLTAQIAAAEAEIDRLVYAAFDLTAEQIACLEASLQGQL